MCLEQMEVRTKQMENLNAHQKRKRNSQMQLCPHFFSQMDESVTKQRHIDHKRREKATQKRDEIENKILYQTRIKKGKMDQLLNQERMRSMSQQLDSSSQFQLHAHQDSDNSKESSPQMRPKNLHPHLNRRGALNMTT